MASHASITVMIFVVLAGYTSASAFLLYSSCPVVVSISITAFAVVTGSSRAAAGVDNSGAKRSDAIKNKVKSWNFFMLISSDVCYD